MTQEINLKKLARALQGEDRVVLFLGAGINYCPGKHLLWEELLSEMVRYATLHLNVAHEEMTEIRHMFGALPDLDGLPPQQQIELLKERLYIQTEFPSEIKASIVKRLLGDAYVPLLQDILYSQCSLQELQDSCQRFLAGEEPSEVPFYSLCFVADMILRHPSIEFVVTYNFDTFLSTAISIMSRDARYAGIRHKGNDGQGWQCVDIGRNDVLPADRRNVLPIYHVHGLIERPDRMGLQEGANPIVLSLEEFYGLAKDNTIWQTALQLTALRRYSCIYLGISLSDMTMQRMLYYADIKAQETPTFFLTASPAGATGRQKILQRLKNSFHAMNGLTVIYDEAGYEHLYDSLIKTLYQ